MTPDPLTVGPHATLKEAETLLAGAAVTTLPVVDDSGVLLGTLGEAELLRAAAAPDPRAHLRRPQPHLAPPLLVEEVAVTRPATVRPGDDVATAVALMAATDTRSLPVVDVDHRVVGILTRSDVVRALARPDRSIAAEVRRILDSVGGGSWRVSVVDGRVAIDGTTTTAEGSLADAVARTVSGVVDVRVT
ncbi:CBS domain-containing protein [Nocardioides sp. Leaf374]|uniref:CBS domain-containing protein n=1 Tax=Nocardioides sp. Leaf374 TaxID=2876560 RepID=UPI001E574DD4|nr:CBS domain-containing protein [Nocardioides sp. Leaf374]